MTDVVLKNRTIHDHLSGKSISVILTDGSQLFVKAKSDLGIFVGWHEQGPHIRRIVGHREYMSSPMYGFAEPTWARWLKGAKVLATLTDGKHLVVSKVNGEFTWIGWNISTGPYFAKQDAHTELFGQGLEGLAEMFAKAAYKRRQI